jgi:hypothetical protein
MRTEKGIVDPHPGRPVVDDADLLVAGMEMEAVILLGNAVERGGFPNRGTVLVTLFDPAQLPFKSLLDEFVLDLGGDARLLFCGHVSE